MFHDLLSHADLDFLSDEQKLALSAIERGCNVFITGGAGTGKSFLLNYLKKHLSDKGLAITASTGIAAVNVGGSTIHSWAGIGLANAPIPQIIQNIFSVKFSKIRRRIRTTRILAIDEISMISPNLLVILDEVFRAVRQNDKPMGGMQILFFGDFLQLPPITNFGQEIEFCFDSEIWKKLALHTFNLKTIFRQNDQKFVKILNNLRFGNLDDDDINELQTRLSAKDKNIAIKPTILTSHNAKVAQINESELRKIPNEEKEFTAKFHGDANKIELLKKNCLAQERLKLKVGAQVMMIKNTYQKEGIINGSLGIIRSFSTKKFLPVVEFSNGKILTISAEEWLIEKFDQEKNQMVVESGMLQIPLILSWAITIHKSQGLTLDKISCDLADIFSPGQAYVALSRARNLDGVFISAINFDRITANKNATVFYDKLKNEA